MKKGCDKRKHLSLKEQKQIEHKNMKNEFDFSCPCNCGMDMKHEDYEKFHRGSDDELETPKKEIEQEIMEMFDVEFPFTIIDWKVETNGEEKAVNKTQEIKSFISHIITLVQKREREEMVERIKEAWNYPCTCNKEGLYNQKIKECVHNFSQMHSIINLIKQND